MKQTIIVMAVAAAACAQALAGPLEKAEEGKLLYDQKKYAEAHEKFLSAAADMPEDPRLLFDQAATFYKRGDFDQAVKLYEKALVTKDLQLESLTKYNLGNCLFQQALKKRDDPGKAIELLDRAMSYYHDAMETLADPASARYNLEKAKLLKKQLIDDLKKKQDEQKKQQERNQKDDKKKEDQKKQDEQKKSGDDQKKEEKKGDQKTAGNGQKDKQEQEQQEKQGDEKQVQLSPEEAEKLLNAMREQQKKDEREQRSQRNAERMRVERDW